MSEIEPAPKRPFGIDVGLWEAIVAEILAEEAETKYRRKTSHNARDSKASTAAEGQRDGIR